MSQNLIGTRIGNRYEIKRLLGEGGMAEVYEADQPRLNRKVAVKLLHRHLSTDEHFKARFEREAQAIAQLKHPHIIQVYDFDFDENLHQYYMVIEYIDGPTLSSVLKKYIGQPLPLDHTLRIIEDLTSALGYAHSEGMQHRDIKPSNIILDKGTRTVLTDFGIAKLVQSEGQQLTASGAMVGTPAYISPEQANGEPGDHRSDIYSLGIVFFQLATGRLPYEGETPIATIFKHIKEVPPTPSSINPDIPLGVESIILRCIAKDPTDRYQNTDELLSHLRNLDAAAALINTSRTLSGKLLSDDIFLGRSLPDGTGTHIITPAPHRTPTSMDSVTDTLAVAPRKTSLLIGAGALAIIALLTLGAFLFSTAGNSDKDDPDATANPCVLVLESEIFARSEPDENVTASIPFPAGSEVEFIRQTSNFWLIRGQVSEGWASQSMLTAPDDCQLAS